MNRIKERTSNHDGNKQESMREYLIRTGKIMPFDTTTATSSVGMTQGLSHTNLNTPHHALTRDNEDNEEEEESEMDDSDHDKNNDSDSDEYIPESNEKIANDDDDDYDDDIIDVDEEDDGKKKRIAKLDESYTDDGIKANYDKRLREWVQNRRIARHQLAFPDMTIDEVVEAIGKPKKDDFDEMFKVHPNYKDVEINKDVRVPGEIWDCLFDYQRTCLRWLTELHLQRAGGIIGDEMGLGKTIQVVAFLASLYYSKVLGPGQANIIICPATVMKQWVQEFHKWWPSIRVAILHSSGCAIKGAKKKAHSDDDEYEEEEEKEKKEETDINKFYDIGHLDDDDNKNTRGWHSKKGKKKAKNKKPSILGTKAGKNAAALVDEFIKLGGVLITTYNGVQTYRDVLLKHKWGYVVLDEGHKIRNPDAETAILVKRFKTTHRLILSGTPIQNNLKELWSLFDFIFPGRLGDLPLFEKHFSIPINLGSYANASNVQVQVAYKCALMLRDSINPYLLRRMKADVAPDLPKKKEQVLFCKLTDIQRQRYLDFIGSHDMNSILEHRRHVLFGIDIVRKICNHPDILDPTMTMQNNADYGNPERSGKALVVQALLKMWKETGKHRVLLFCQTRQMLDILEILVRKESYRYLRMDGTTPVDRRIALVNEYNNNPSFYVFLLTTKVGGLGLNLTGADRVILYDPDWNPSTDMQARERAWRLGQKKDVTIYRLMTSGTIEEKIYHRQIYKQFLSNKILVDPKQRRFSSADNVQSLFTLGAEDAIGTETGKLFKGSEVKPGNQKKNLKRKKRVRPNQDDDEAQLKGIEGVDSLEQYAGEKIEKQQKRKRGEDNILNSLFEMTGIQSALEHDRIMNSSHDKILVDQEADRVAKEAAEALKESRRQSNKRFGRVRSSANNTSNDAKKGPLHSSQII
ncbi:hypothetical protein K501DRAFT_219421, partial [Backusella circina FSU 941]